MLGRRPTNENEDHFLDKRQTNCFLNKLQRFKPPIVSSKDFPSKVSLLDEFQTTGNESKISSAKDDSNSAMATRPKSKKPPITYWRRAESFDKEAIVNLIKKSDYVMNDLFGEPDVPNLIEKSSFAILQFNSEEKAVSFTSVFAYPDVPAVPPFEWYPWLQTLYRLKETNPRNCLFIHYMIWDSEYYHDFLRLSLETIYLENNYLTDLIITKPPKAKLPSIIPEYFIQVLPHEAKSYDCDYNSLQTVLLCFRHSIMERLKIRLALVEDHDDLMPIAEQHTDRLRKLYGDYCMAEIIEYPGTKDRRTLVCESKGYAVGFMIINRAVDFELLNSQFDLCVFHGLRKPSEQDKMSDILTKDPEEKPVVLCEKIDPFLEIIDSQTMLKFLNWKPSLCALEGEVSDLKIAEDQDKGYNELSGSMCSLIRETLNVRLVPKFSAHALSLSGSRSAEHDDSSMEFSARGHRNLDESVSDEGSQIASEPSLLSLQHFNLPIFKGPPNAFLIEFFGMHNNFDERLCHEFLEAAFEQFPDLEYCLLTIPSQSRTFPLLDFFTRVTPRPLKRLRQELYVCHKSCVKISFMRVRKVIKTDLKEIQTLLNGIQNQEHIFADIASSCYYEDSAYQGFVLVCSKAIVGMAVLCNEYGMEYLAHHYYVSDLIDFDLHKIDYHAILKHLVLSPIYQPHAKFFLRDIMRMADVTSLYRARYEEAESNWDKSSLITVLGQLTPIKPRKMVKYHEQTLGRNVPPSYFLHRDTPFSLHHINSRICQIKKLTCNINLVIVGSSRTAYSFLETLLFSPSASFVTYHNITWVAPHGMGTELPSHPARDLIFPYEGKYNRFYKIQICLKTYIHFVYGIMTNINRVDKYIMINNDSILPYDYLVLLCGRQFVMPVPVTLMDDSKVCRRNFRPRCSLFKYLNSQSSKEQTSKTIYPANVFLINTDVDATNAFISLQYLYQKRKNTQSHEKIIIYGHNISTYLCTQALLKYGIQPDAIAIVEPFPIGTHSISCFHDDNIDRAVLQSLNELGVHHYKGYILYDWTLCNNNQIQTATFHSDFRKVTLKCLAMFPFEKKSVSDLTFKAVNEASLVYDGKLVINNRFQTNDPYIYAAGGLTKYKRKYYAKNKGHHNYSSTEIGKHLAKIVGKKIDPTQEDFDEEPSELVPNMTEPIIIYGVLPGDWKYFSARKPGKFVHPETQAGIKEFGDVLITGDCEMTDGIGYFKLLLDDSGFVSGIYCFTKDEIDYENYEELYGKHEKLLNNLLLRFEIGLISDFYSYFREPWVYAIYHDRFNYITLKNIEFFYDDNFCDGKEKLIDVIIRILKANKWQKPAKEKLLELKQKFEETGIRDKVIENVLDFLWYFDEPFPMYATPRILKVLLHDATTSLLHKNLASSGASKTGV